ncbi:ABC transporter substrate-binding protein [Bauldia sp.]|uniref:ABC transporter substrate-binding protein n=1 Tax=Bauldia sp. TaxID=2575872 RepID=UPI003BAA33B2
MRSIKNRTAIAGAAAAFLASTMLATAAEEVTWWYEAANPEQQGHLTDFLIDAFNQNNPDHELTIDYRGAELTRQLRVAMLADSGPDVVMTPGPAYVATMAQAGQLMSLDDLADELGWNDRLLEVFLDLGRYEGQLYALPKTYETLGLFHNKQMFEENGWETPSTIAELEAIADDALAKGIIPFGAGNSNWQGANEWHVTMVMNSIAGPDNVYKALTGEIPWTSEPFVEAIETLQRWWDAGYFGEDYLSTHTEEAFAMIADGRAAMSPVGTWAFQFAPTYFEGMEDQIAFSGFPSADGVPYPVYPLGIGTTLSIAAAAENPDGAAAVLDYVFGEEFYTNINTVWQAEWNTPLRDLSAVSLGDEVLPQYTDAMAELATTVDETKYGYTSWTFLPPATNNYLIGGIEEVWFGRVTPEEYLQQLDDTFQQELTEGKVPAIPPR